MKKIVSVLMLCAAACVLLAACDTKLCYCYTYSSNGSAPREVEEYTDAAQACQALNRGVAGNGGSRVCVESNERMDPSSLVYK